MKIKLLYFILLVFISFKGVAQNKWVQKINFSKTARIVGKVSNTAGKIAKKAPGLIGSTAKMISTTTNIISSGAEQLDAKQKKKKEKTN